MEKKTYTLNTLLAAVFTVLLLVAMAARALLPRLILPQPDIPTLVLISLIALVLDHYVAKGAKRCYLCIPIFAALTFGLLPFAACFVGIFDALKLGLLGAVVFTATTWVYTSVVDRLSSGPQTKAAPIASALGLYLAVQALMSLGI